MRMLYKFSRSMQLAAVSISGLLIPTSAQSQLQSEAEKRPVAPCAVTKPPAQPFVPPSYVKPLDGSRFWLGHETFWTALDVTGIWHLRGKAAYSEKLTYWRQGFDWRNEPNPDLIVTARRLDQPAATVSAEQAHPIMAKEAITTVINIPSAGCWEISARFHGKKLDYIVSVEP